MSNPNQASIGRSGASSGSARPTGKYASGGISQPQLVGSVKNIVPPQITGIPEVGETLTTVPGIWTGGPTITREWRGNGVAIPGETGLTITLAGAQAGQVITVREKANNSDALTATSSATVPVAFGGVLLQYDVGASYDAGTLYQDAAKTTPATIDGELVDVVGDSFGAFDWVGGGGASRGILRAESGGKWSLEHTGNDVYTATGVLSGTPSAAYVGYRLRPIAPDTFTKGISKLRAFGSPNDNTCLQFSSGNWLMGMGTTVTATFPNSNPGNVWCTVEVIAEAGSYRCFYDGVEVVTRASNTIPAWEASPQIGGNGSAAFWQGRIAGMILLDTAPAPSYQAALRAYLDSLAS